MSSLTIVYPQAMPAALIAELCYSLVAVASAVILSPPNIPLSGAVISRLATLELPIISSKETASERATDRFAELLPQATM